MALQNPTLVKDSALIIGVMPTAAKEEKFSAPMVWTDECVLPLAASGVYPKTRVWGSREKTLPCFSATAPLSAELHWGCGNSSGKTTAGSALDANGNTQTKIDGTGTTTYAWDFENRLITVTLPAGGGTVSFKYDPFGRRIYKSSSSGTWIFAYDGDNLIEETNSSGTVVARYSQGLNVDEPLAMLRSSTTSYYQADGLDSVSSLSNAAGALAQTYTFDSFGNQTASSGSLTNSFRYAGREFDAETGLYYMRARYFDPATGRFLNEDPTGFDGDAIDFYGYAGENPTNSIDPFGEQQGAGTTTAPAPPTTNPPSAPPVKAPPRPIPDPPLPTPQPGPGLWPGIGAILGRGVIFGLGELLLAPATARDEDLLPKPHDKAPPCDNKNGPDCKKADQFHLDGAGISDPHEFKKEHLGRKAPISRYDICACNDGSIVIKPRGQCGSPGPGIDTGHTWK